MPSVAAPVMLSVSPAHASCNVFSGNVVCAADDTDGFSDTNVGDFTVNQGVTVDDSAADRTGTSLGVVDIGNDVTGTFLNNGTIQDLGGAADGLFVDNNLNALINNGTITGGDDGVHVNNVLTSLTNNGTITGLNDGVFGTTITTLVNTNTISGNGNGIDATTITTLINSGTINSDGTSDAIEANLITSLTNSGTIRGGDNALDVETIITLNNSGDLIGTDDGIRGDGITTLINSGTITATTNGDGLNLNTVGSLTNSGTISGIQDGVDADTITELTNTGTISGGQEGVDVDTVTTLTNSGTIIGGTRAIDASSASDMVLNLNAGSVLVGAVDLGSGTHTLNIGEGLSLNSTFLGDNLASLVNIGSTGGQLVATSDTGTTSRQVVTVDSSAFTATDDALVALTANIGQSVQARQTAVRADPTLRFASSFAAAEEAGSDAFTSHDLEQPASLNPNRFWVQGFGTYRHEAGSRTGGDFDHMTGGLVAGFDVPVDAASSVGVMAGFAISRAENETNTQTNETSSFFGGIYGSTQAMGLAWDASLTLGYSDYDQERETANNLVPGGIETARADFDGWFINPQVTMTGSFANPWAGSALGSLMASDTLEKSLTLAYAGLFVDGYTETGTTNPLTLDDRSIHIASARAALALPFERVDADGTMQSLRFIGGLEARLPFGDDDVSGTLLGQNVTTSLSDDDAAFGGFFGLSAEHTNTSGLTAYANAEAMLETDASFQLSANAGLRIAF